MQKLTGRPAAFTLIEILLAMAIMAVICGTIYQFTGTTVRVADVATRIDAREEALGGLRRLLEAQFAALPTSEPQALTGASNHGEHGRMDILQMLCPAGGALLTPDARGLYQVAFQARELPAGSGHHVLVLNREPWSANQDEENNQTNAATRPDGWVRLLDGVRSLEFDYFDPRLNTWVDKWNDPTMAPSLVRVRMALENGGAPYEFVEKVPGGGVPRLPANLAAAALTLPNGAFPTVTGNAPGAAPVIAKGGGLAKPPTAPPPGPPPTLPSGLRPPPAVPGFDPTKPLTAPNTGTGL